MTRHAYEDSLAMEADSQDIVPGDSRAARRAQRAGLGLLFLGVLIAAMWIGAAAVGGALLIGAERLSQLSWLERLGAGMATILPAMLILFCGLAAREGARARAEARRLADAADRMINPSPAARNAASRVGAAVRHEIDVLDRALESVLLKLRETDQQVARQANIVHAAAETAKSGAQSMILGMERERDALVQIATDLNAQAKLIGDQISRHARVLADAARLAETEVRAADQQLDERLSAFSAATHLIGDRTHALHAAAQNSADSALRLESALSGALDVLAKATSLTDAARQNAEQATRAADLSANAARDTAGRALDDAKHAADLIRTEAAAMERDAARAMERLKDAALTARSASDDVRAAAAAGVSAQLQARHSPAPPPEGPQRSRGMFGAPAPSGRPNGQSKGRFGSLSPIGAPVDSARAASPVSGDRPDDLDSAWNSLEREVAPSAPPMSPIAQDAGVAQPQKPPRKFNFVEQLSGVAFQRNGAPRPGAKLSAPAAPNAPTAPGIASRSGEIQTDPRAEGRADGRNVGGGWRWRDMLASIDREDRRAGAPVTGSARTGDALDQRRPQEARHSASAFGIDAESAAGVQPSGEVLLAPSSAAHRLVTAAPNGLDRSASLSARGAAAASVVGFARPSLPVIIALEKSGIALSDVFGPGSLDRIAQRARNGTQARRRAVRDVAGEAVLRLENALRVDSALRGESGAFMRSEGARIAELLGRGRAVMSADATRAFLLLDAASA
jgi:hypothetical protein